jgi:rSAM/selenodomain-associated transferase 1
MPWWSDRVTATVDKPVYKVDNSANRLNFSHNGAVLGLFAKQPVPGQVKTRLCPPLTTAQACHLYEVALRETFARMAGAGLPLLICYAGAREWFTAAFPGVPLLAQVGEDLGQRMEHAVNALFAAGAGPVLLAGSDSPDLPVDLVVEVVERLRDHDVAVIPCLDGGYVVIGLRQPAAGLFTAIPWSSSRVMAATRQRCRAIGLTLHETAAWQDLDQPADLQGLLERSPQSQTARHILATLGELFQPTGRKAGSGG